MIGTEIGDLKIVRQLGEGGMSTVYLAEHALLNDLQAVKILAPELSGNPQVVTRFLNEGRAAVKLRHPHLVAVHDVGRLPDDGPWYMVMEYLEGGTLARFNASQGGPVPVHTILYILAQAMSCMQWIHDRGVVHRDLKPENLFLVRRPGDPSFIKVLDLGVALVTDAIASSPGTEAGTVIGTPVYMAPEQLRGERVTAVADIFALGTIVYEMATGGWFPWQRDDEPRAAYLKLPSTEIYHRHRSSPAIDPRRRFSGISEGWARAILRTVDPDPQNRPQTDRELALLLAENVPGDGIREDGYEILRLRARDLVPKHALDTLRSVRPSPPPAAPAPSNKLRYRLGQKLGAGGMAEVFEGHLLGIQGFERRVAIKRVLAGLSEVPTFVDMFVVEAQISSRLDHVNVVSVIDFERDADHRLCLVMEYVHGRDLATVLERGPIAPSLVIYIVTEMLRGLGYAHAPEAGRDGIVHRDVSPQNLLVSYEGAVKVSDFGLAKARDASGNAMSLTVRGKPSYMSPEQCNGDVLDARSDLFAVGVMMWEMLAHEPLFTGSAREVIAQILHRDIPAPSSAHGRVPADLEAITRKLLARDRNDRYPDAEAVIADLVRCEDAPRDGRSELVRVLAERFPEGALRTRIGGTAPSGGGSGRELPAAQFAVPDVPFTTASASIPASTLQGAASQPVQRGSSSRRWGIVAGGCLLVAVFIAAAALTRGQVSKRRDHHVAAQGQPTHPDAAPVAWVDANTPGARAQAAHPVSVPDAAPAAPAAPARAPAVVVAPSAGQPAAPSAVRTPTVAPDTPTAGARTQAATASATRQPAPPVAPPDTSARDAREPAKPASTSAPVTAQPAAVKRTGELAILVKPWALIWLNGKSAGQTPFREKLPVGRYRLRIQNDETGKDETVTVTVTADKTTTIERTW